MGGRQRPFKASDAVENMGSEEGSSVERVSWSESSRRQTNMVSGRSMTSALKALSDCCSRNHSLDVRSTMLLVRQNVGSCCT